ncbi:hypothetical protein ACFPMF_23645 [Larkinella bovis]|uniref:Uncharacterized protein n=1 Tax=Larkinella bovis TaxID=683041 RepID=A0ABW0IHK5_9BACT
MNTNDVKNAWNAYKDRIGEESVWREEELLRLVTTPSGSRSWYQAYQHVALNFGVVFLLMGLTTGC